MTSIEELNPELEGHRPLRVRLGRLGRRRRHRAARPQRGRRPRHLLEEERAAVDARPAPEGPEALPPQADAALGRRPGDDRLRQHQVLRPVHARSRPTSWDDLPEDIKNTYDKLGIPEAEKQRLVAGVAAQYESEVVYHQIREDLEEQGVLFLDTDTALREHAGALQGVLRHRHPGRRQQVRRAEHLGVVRRLVHLRAARASTSTSRCRPTSGSTPRTWASSSGP